MDTPSESRQIDHERKLDGKPLLPNPIAENIREGLRKLNAEKDAHSPYCPMGMVGKISTACFCKELAASELAAKIESAEDVCQRCKAWPKDCRCPEDRRQWV